MSQNLSFDPETVTRHCSKMATESDSLAGCASGSTSADISAAFGVMCQFIAGDFMKMADAVETGLTTARENLKATGSNLDAGNTALVSVDTESTTAITESDAVVAEVATDALRIATRLR